MIKKSLSNIFKILILINLLVPTTSFSSHEEHDNPTAQKRGLSPEKVIKIASKKPRIYSSPEDTVEGLDKEKIIAVKGINDLLPETLVNIFSFLEKRSYLANAALVSKDWYKLSKDDALLPLNFIFRHQVQKESRLPAQNLIYAYESTYFDHTPWSLHAAKVIKKTAELLQDKQSNLKTINVILARISLVYDEQGTHEIKESSYTIKRFFTSQWPSNLARDTIKQSIQEMQNHYGPIAERKFKDDQHFPQFRDFKPYHLRDAPSLKSSHEIYKKYLRSILALQENESSHLDEKRIEDRLETIHSPEFYLKYFHTEEVLMLYLKDMRDEYFPALTENIMKGSKILNVILDLASYWDTCEQCGDVLLRESEHGRAFLIGLNAKLKESGYDVLEKAKIFMSATGLYPVADKKAVALRKRKNEMQTVLNQHGVIDLNDYNHFVIQFYQDGNAKEFQEWSRN